MFNRKKLCLVILLTFVLGLSNIIYLSRRKEVPNLVVTYNGLNVPVGQGFYRWKSRSKFKVHTIDSYAGILSNLSPVIKVLPNEKLKLKFNYQPESIIFSDGNNNNGKIVKDNAINISRYDTGTYFLDCKWKEGNVIYLFYVEIQGVNNQELLRNTTGVL